MLCPNCHSKQIITVQDQQFCINCGQIVPPEKTKGPAGSIKIQQNGLPEGVTIIGNPGTPLDGATGPDTAVGPAKPIDSMSTNSLVRPRRRIATTAAGPDHAPAGPAPADAGAKPKKRKPGRPKAGRLDAPRPAAVPATAPAAADAVAAATVAAATTPTAPAKPVASDAPAPTPAPALTPAPTPVPAPTPAPAPAPHHGKPRRVVADISKPAKKPKPEPPAHHVHRVGIAPLHFGSVIGFTLRSTFGKHHLALASLSGVVVGAAGTLGAWLYLTNQLPSVANRLLAGNFNLVLHIICLAALYYIGRTIGQSAIIYGVAREADARPVSLGTQLGIAINTFGRRLELDLISGLASVFLLSLTGLLVATGGTSWQVSPQIQLAVLFVGFLGLLYLITANSITHGLAGVAIVLTRQPAYQALSWGWRLFSHRFELVGIRFFATTLEILLAAALTAAALGLIVTVPRNLQLIAVLGAGIIAWLCGAVIGAGSATWWTTLYSKIVHLDHPNGVLELLSSRQPVEADRLKLVFIVGLTGFILAVSTMAPWLRWF